MEERLKYIKSALLILSTLFIPTLAIGVILIIPFLYVSFIVPYLLWKIWFKGRIFRTKYWVFWKLPITLILLWGLFWEEMFIPFIGTIVSSSSDIVKLLVFFTLILLLRFLTYLMMLFIWKSNILEIYKNVIFIVIIIYCWAVIRSDLPSAFYHFL